MILRGPPIGRPGTFAAASADDRFYRRVSGRSWHLAKNSANARRGPYTGPLWAQSGRSPQGGTIRLVERLLCGHSGSWNVYSIGFCIDWWLRSDFDMADELLFSQESRDYTH